VGDLNVRGEAEFDEVVKGQELGGGEDAALVASELPLEDRAVEMAPVLVCLCHSARITDDVNVITVSNDEEVIEFRTKLGERAMDC
jgi:hypothetical protein